jgi:Ca2+-binding RTX toxin-like protein
MHHRTLYGTLAALALLGSLILAAPSRAATLDLTTGGQLVYEANQSHDFSNALTISLAGGTYTIHDPAEMAIGVSGSALTAGCAVVSNQMVTCPTGPIASLAVDTKNGGDTIDLRGVIHAATITGGGGSDTIFGGPQDDTIVWNTFDGSDVVDGGPGTDTLSFESGSTDGTADGYDHDTVTIQRNGAGFVLYRDMGNVALDVDATEVLLVSTFGGYDTVATTGLAGTIQTIATTPDGQPDTLTFDAAGDCPATAPGWIAAPGYEPVQYTGFDTVSVIGDDCPVDTCNGIAATSGCTVNGVPDSRCLGTDGPDVIRGTAGADVIVGGGGEDRIYAGAGNDLACGDDGNDVVEGERGNDFLLGGGGADRMQGNAGGDDLIGGDGNDDLRGDAGIDDLTGGPGDDRLRGGGDRDVLQGSEGVDVLDGGSAVDTCTDVDQEGPFPSCELPTIG